MSDEFFDESLVEMYTENNDNNKTHAKPLEVSISENNWRVPSKYTYRIYISSNTTTKWIQNMAEYTNVDGNIGTTDGSACLSDGVEYVVHGVELYAAFKQIPPTSGYLYFKSKEDAVELEHVFDRLDREKQAKFKRPIHSLTMNGWRLKGQYDLYEEKNYLGYQEYIQRILKDVGNMHANSTFLDSIGEGNRSLNYLLYGLPGTGKTTLVKIIANLIKAPIYNVKGTDTFNFTLSELLTPKRDSFDNTKAIVLLFEDFDRNLTKYKLAMDDILNALDGIQNDTHIIRFFTGNNCNVIFENAALMSRFNHIFAYDTPTPDMLRHKLYKFLSNHTNGDDSVDTIEAKLDLEKINKFMNAIVDLQNKSDTISLRTFANYVKIYIFNKDTYLDDMITNIDNLETHHSMILNKAKKRKAVEDAEQETNEQTDEDLD
jgi:hypothetical protein